MRWGRNATVAAETAGAAPRYGRRSVLFALAALFLVGASFSFLVAQSGRDAGVWETVGNVAALASYLVAAPILHGMGLISGVRGLFGAGGSRVTSLFGILLNLALVGTGLYIGSLALGSMGAFT